MVTTASYTVATGIGLICAPAWCMSVIMNHMHQDSTWRAAWHSTAGVAIRGAQSTVKGENA